MIADRIVDIDHGDLNDHRNPIGDRCFSDDIRLHGEGRLGPNVLLGLNII